MDLEWKLGGATAVVNSGSGMEALSPSRRSMFGQRERVNSGEAGSSSRLLENFFFQPIVLSG